ncbi:MAG TPA: aminomethyltransferase family protein [Blastocatellia bacterium]|nr:aminomethyltransferase family protein [Blastocatellia bacterium]
MTTDPLREPAKTMLYEAQSAIGARFGDVFGWEMALDFGDVLAEVRHARASVGVVDLSYSGAILIGGKEGAQFLNGLVTNNVKTLENGKGLRAGFLTGHGKVKALCRILGLGDQFLVINDPQTHEKVLSYVQPFTYAGDFKAEEVSARYRVLSIQGPKSLSVMKEVCFEPVPALLENEWIGTIVAGHNVLVVSASHTGDPGYDILVPDEGVKDVWDFLMLKGEFHSIRPVGLKALDHLRIEAGIPVYGIDADETNMMLEAGLEDAVSYSKGCYTGQEAVAMATYRGHVSKKLSGLIVEGGLVPSAGASITRPDTGKEIGRITSAIQSETLGKTIALGYVKYGMFEPGTTLNIALAEGKTSATIVPLPFVHSQALVEGI